MDSVKAGHLGQFFVLEYFVFGKTGIFNIWTHGYYIVGAGFTDSILAFWLLLERILKVAIAFKDSKSAFFLL